MSIENIVYNLEKFLEQESDPRKRAQCQDYLNNIVIKFETLAGLATLVDPKDSS